MIRTILTDVALGFAAFMVLVLVDRGIVLPILKKLEAIRLLLDELVQVSRRERSSGSYLSKPVFPASEPDTRLDTPDQVLRER